MSSFYEKTCPYCPETFTTKNPRKVTCGKPSCVAENNRVRTKLHARESRKAQKKFQNQPVYVECPLSRGVYFSDLPFSHAQNCPLG